MVPLGPPWDLMGTYLASHVPPKDSFEPPKNHTSDPKKSSYEHPSYDTKQKSYERDARMIFPQLQV